MKKFKLKILFILSLIITLLSGSYLIFLFVLPPVLNSNYLSDKARNFVYDKFAVAGDAINFKVNTYPNLLISAEADEIHLKDKKNTELLEAKNISLSFDLKKFALKDLNIDYIFLNEMEFKNLLSKNKNKKTSDFKIKQFPEIKINKAEIWADKGDIDSIFVTLSNIHVVTKNDNKTYCTFEAEIISNLLRNLVNIGKNGYLYIEDNALYAKDLQVLVGISELDINGKIIDDEKQADFTVKGNNLPISDAHASLLYFQKLKDSSKKFIENFYNFSGLIDIDLKITQEGLFGNCTAKNLSAKTTLFDVPILFKNVVFELNKRNMSAAAFGLLGGEKVFTSFSLTDMGTENQEVNGVVKALLTNKSAGKYVPDLSILGFADTSVDYKVKNKKIYVNYLLKIDKGSDLLYKNAFLGLKDKNRRMFVNTVKEPDKLYVTHYDYSSTEGNKVNNIIFGDGLLVKKDGHLSPDFITCKTNGYAPVSVTGSFGRYIKGGFFNGDLKYDFVKNLLTGNFEVKNSAYNDFFVENAKIEADNQKVFITANGKYINSPFECKFEAENNFVNKITIYDMYLFLDRYIIPDGKSSNQKPGTQKQRKFDFTKEPAITHKDIDLSIYNWIIKINKIKRNKIELNNILLNGSFINDVFKFSMPNVDFAKGNLKAEGTFKKEDKSAIIDFSAINIDSNTVADIMFDLPNQIEGLANASLHLETKNFLQDVKANAAFSMDDGYLPKLGSTEFIIKKSKKIKRPLKFKISDIINVDITKAKALSSDLNGSFTINNHCIEDVYITSQQKYLSFLIEGNYDINEQDADLRLWGKYNKNAQKGIKILFVPLSLIVKLVFRPEHTMDLYKESLDKVPSIQALPEEESAFRVKLNGNLNDNTLKVELKSVL